MAQQRMNVQAPIERLFAQRWSTRAFDPDKAVASEQLAACLEAARWAPSCFGEEPWRYIVADRFVDADSWARVHGALAPKNGLWAQHAPILIVAAAEETFSHNGNANRWSEYDTGQATICLSLQAAAEGLVTHQMGGFDADALKQLLGIPERLHVMSVIAMGYPASPASLDEDFQPMESAPRSRKPLQETVHAGLWGKAWQPPAGAGWEARYQESPVAQLPWFHDRLDSDIEQALERFGITAGDLLDLGCGPGTQAVALARRGFAVTATDISASAVASARKLAAEAGVVIDAQVDDLLDSGLSGPFDLVIDRGIFHCFEHPDDQQAYLATVKRLLKAEGLLLLKCFHKDETGEMGPPCRYGETDIQRLFGDGFELIEARNSRFDGVMERVPKALFCVLRKRCQNNTEEQV